MKVLFMVLFTFFLINVQNPLLFNQADTFETARDQSQQHGSYNWVVHYPGDFHDRSAKTGELIDNRSNGSMMRSFRTFIDKRLQTVDGYTDGEIVDVVEHFFWGQTEGLAMELGALDGSLDTHSMTFDLEDSFGWKRILVDGNPTYRSDMKRKSPRAFSVNAAICEKQSKVHYIPHGYTGGILEFMGLHFLRDYHRKIYDAGTPHGNLDSIDWGSFPQVQLVDCIPLSHVFAKAKVRHVNFFILDVEGGELEVLKSINWMIVKFDVLCIETDPANRSRGYADTVTKYLATHGYAPYAGQQGRNIWYVRNDFVPRKRTGLGQECFNGMTKAFNVDQKYENRNTPDWHPCPVVSEE